MSEEKYPNLAAFDPRNCISGKVMRCSRIISKVFRTHLLDFDVTNSQLTILFIISKRKEITQVELGRMLYMEKSTVTRNLNRLFKSKYISKNKRQVYTTEKGKSFLDKVIPVWENAMAEIRAKLGEEGEEALNGLVFNLTQKENALTK